MCGLAIPYWARPVTRRCALSLGDCVQPHTYSNSLIHKSHRLTLGSPRRPDRREQKPKEESRQEEEEEEVVSVCQGKKEREEER